MWTHGYKGMYIHGYFDADRCCINDGKGFSANCKSYRAAQLAITRRIKSQL